MAERQQGRSINEMLMTLAIIAVISIGSYAGIKMALVRNQVNNLIEDVKLAGFVVIDGLFETVQNAENGEIPLAGKFAQKTSYVFKALSEADSTTTFDILVGNVSSKVCKEVIKRQMDWLEEIRANGVANACHETDDNDIDFFFNTNLNTQKLDNYCQKDADCGECGKCKDNRQCEYGIKNSNGTCYLCSVNNAISNTNYENCQKCKNRFFYGTQNTCLLCSANTPWGGTTKEDCLKCNKLGYNKAWVSGNGCWNCEGTLVEVSNGNVVCNWDCGPDKIGTKGDCRQCSDFSHGSFHYTTLTDCQKCGNHFYTGDNEVGGSCFICTESAWPRANVRYKDCQKCSNRYWYNVQSNGLGNCDICSGTVSADGTQCDWNCSEGQFGAGNKCLDCNPTANSANSTLKSCRQCANMFYTGNDIFGGKCVGCNLPYSVGNTRKSDCLRCNEAGYSKYWLGTYTDENSLGDCLVCSGTVSEDGTKCIK